MKTKIIPHFQNSPKLGVSVGLVEAATRGGSASSENVMIAKKMGVPPLRKARRWIFFFQKKKVLKMGFPRKKPKEWVFP